MLPLGIPQVRFEKMHSQKLFDIEVAPVRVGQFMSGKLKSPRIKTGLGKVVIVAK